MATTTKIFQTILNIGTSTKCFTHYVRNRTMQVIFNNLQIFQLIWLIAITLILSACDNVSQTKTQDFISQETFVWPSSLNVFASSLDLGDSRCQALGESAATVAYMDHAAILIGCPDVPSQRYRDDTDRLIQKYNAVEVGRIEDVRLFSIPDFRGNITSKDSYEHDAIVEGTVYHATAKIPCSREGVDEGWCEVGVLRENNQGDARVDIMFADGFGRSLFFEAGHVSGAGQYGAETAEIALITRQHLRKEIDEKTVTILTEQYVIFDTLIYGD